MIHPKDRLAIKKRMQVIQDRIDQLRARVSKVSNSERLDIYSQINSERQNLQVCKMKLENADNGRPLNGYADGTVHLPDPTN